MLLMNRFGLFGARVSIRVNVTSAFGASAFFEMKTRPVVVAAQSVFVSELILAKAATLPPERVVPRKSVPLPTVSLVSPGGPIATKSPQAGFAEDVVNTLQFASK